MDFCFHISSWLIIWLLLIPQIRGGYFSSVSLWRFWHMCLRVLFSLPCFHFFKIIFLWLLSICQSFLKLISLLCWAFSVEACLSGTLCPSFCTPYPWCWFCCCLSPTPCPSLRTRSRLEVQAPVLVDVEDNADMLPGLGALCFLLLLQTSGFITAVTPAAFTEAFSISPTGRVCFVWHWLVQCHESCPELLVSTCTLAATSSLWVLVPCQASPCFWTRVLWLQPLLPARCSMYLIWLSCLWTWLTYFLPQLSLPSFLSSFSKIIIYCCCL